jgi:hypothetical protein
MERFNIRKLNEVESKQQYRVEISNSFAGMENLDSVVDINLGLETISENIKISAKENLGYYELKKHKPLFDAQNYEFKGNKSKCKCYTFQAK